MRCLKKKSVIGPIDFRERFSFLSRKSNKRVVEHQNKDIILKKNKVIKMK